MKMENRFHSHYDPPPQVGIVFTEPTLTQDHFKDECDINNILAKYSATGILPQVQGGYYDDLTQDFDYRTAMDTLLAADEAFAQLPSAVRRRFDNDPASFLEFVTNPANKEEAGKLGLLNSNTQNNSQNTTQSPQAAANPPGNNDPA